MMKPLKMVSPDGWLYPEGRVGAKQVRTKIGQYKVAYKLHITLSDSTYQRDRDYVASFLYNNGFKFKCHKLRGMAPDEEDRAFTIYPEKESDLVDIVAGIIELQKKHNLTAGAPSGDGIVVPGTSGLVTYHVERINEKLLRDMDSAGAFSDYTKRSLYFGDKLSEVRVKSWLKKDNGYIGKILPKSLRVDAMKFLFGRGPLDFLWSGGWINTEVSDPEDPPVAPPSAVATKTAEEEHIEAFVKRATSRPPPKPWDSVGKPIQVGRRRNLN